jgi:hypothetical protein
MTHLRKYYYTNNEWFQAGKYMLAPNHMIRSRNTFRNLCNGGLVFFSIINSIYIKLKSNNIFCLRICEVLSVSK